MKVYSPLQTPEKPLTSERLMFAITGIIVVFGAVPGSYLLEEVTYES